MAQPAGGIPFGSYRLLRRIARGGMAEVFLARQRGPEGFDRIVAVKRILPHLVEQGEFIRMFLDEARLAAQLSHPNIAHIYEFGKNDDHYFIAMEYVDGVHAGALIKHGARERMPCDLVARIGADAFAALHYAHALRDGDGRPLRIVHRDISPPNVLLSFDGVVKLVDFGIAKAATSMEHTRPGVVKGKFAYMSPEQCSGKQLTGASDVFSLGIVLWELLAGQIMIDRDDPVAGMRRIREGALPELRRVRPEVPEPLAAVVRRAMAPRVEDRASPSELGVALEEYLKASPRLATTMVVSEWLSARFTRERVTGQQQALASGPGTVAATATSAPAATPVATPVATTQAPATAHTTIIDQQLPTEVIRMPTSAEAEPPRGRWRRGALIAAVAAAAAVIGIWGLQRNDAPAEPAAAAVEAPPPPDAHPVIAVGLDPDAAPAPVPDAAPARAVVEVITSPAGADVALDGEPTELRTPVRFEDLEPGEHVIALSLAGHERVERRFRVAAGERRSLDYQLAAISVARPDKPTKPPKISRNGRLSVRTDPWSDVYLGSKKLGTTPFANVELPAGTHTLVFKNPGRKPHRQSVRIRPGRTAKLNIRLP